MLFRGLTGLGSHRRGSFKAAASGGRHKFRTGIDVRAVLDKHFDSRRMALGDRPHQGGRIAPSLLRVHLRSQVQQHFERVGLPGARRHHERGVSRFRQRGVGVRAGLDELFNHGRIAIHGGEKQRCGALAVRGRYVGAGADQQLRHFQIVSANSPVERGGAVNLRRIDIGLPLQQGAHSLFIPLHGGVRQIASGCAQKAGGRQQHGHTAPQYASHIHLCPLDLICSERLQNSGASHSLGQLAMRRSFPTRAL